MRILLPFLTFLILTIPACSDKDSEFQKNIQQLEKESGGLIGLAIYDLNSRQGFDYKGHEPFPMLSVFKFPIAVHTLKLVEKGEFNLSDSIQFTDQYLRWGYSRLTNKSDENLGQFFSYQELLEQMVLVSDNSACDILIEKTGGPQAITQTLIDFGIQGINIKRSEHEQHADLYLIDQDKLPMMSYNNFLQAIENASHEDLQKGFQNFLKEKRDASSPLAMIQLMQKFQNGTLLNDQNTVYLKDLMIKAPIRNTLIKSGVPPGAKVAHKSGGMFDVDGVNGAENDVALIYLPEKKEPVLLAIFVKGSKLNRDQRSNLFKTLTQNSLQFILNEDG